MKKQKEKLTNLLEISPSLNTLSGTPEEFEENAEFLIAHGITVRDTAHWVLEVERGSCMDYHVHARCSNCGWKWFGRDGVGNHESIFGAFVQGDRKQAEEFVLEQAQQPAILEKLYRCCPNCCSMMSSKAEF